MLKPLNLPIDAQINSQTHWQTDLSQCITNIDELLAELKIDSSRLTSCQRAAAQFALRVPRPFVERMKKGDPNDPLLAQVLPVKAEMQLDPAYSKDPLNESSHNPIAGIVHKYRHRLLLIVSPACAINCRYCFRRHFPYQENRQSKAQWQQALEYISGNTDINEVIFSGGDPLAANDQFLGWLAEQVAAIPHIRRLRIHSRLPVVIPSRIDESFLRWATASRLKPIMVLHINHSNEIDKELTYAIERLLNAGIRVLNQTVLLKGVNDSASTLAALSERLFDCAVTPYYLHLLDPVQGASHFDITPDRASQIYRELQNTLPGFLLPKLVREIPGELSKAIISTNS
jgi:EF-P beta-lysylation protein EpmB